MNRTTLVEHLVRYFTKHARELPIELAFLYGSWAAERQRADSDVDVAVLFRDDAGSEEEKYAVLTDVGSELAVSLQKEVSVLELKWAFDKPMLYYNAVVQGVPLWVKEQRLSDRFRHEAIEQMEDFCIFGIGWQLAAARCNLKGVTHA